MKNNFFLTPSNLSLSAMSYINPSLFILLGCFTWSFQLKSQDLNEQASFYSFHKQSLTKIISRDSIIFKKCFDKPEKWGFIKYVPDDIWQLSKSPFQKKNLTGLAVVSVTSALLIWQDQPIFEGVKQFASNIHLSGETTNNVPVKIKDARIIKIPQNLNTALYQLGEGGTSMYIAGGLYIYGRIKHDNRSLQAFYDITETFITVGAATQLIKRITGRQTPYKSTRSGGKWQPFPSFRHFQDSTPVYDAFPSGHLATMIATVTVLSLHYPEKKWIKPVGYLICALTSFAMMNTGVHWAGDYPLAISIGYLAGKIATSRNKPKSTY